MSETRAGQAGVVRPWALYVGLALTTCSMLLVQQFLTRVFSILFNSGLAFLAISITFLGLGSAGVCVYVFPRWFEDRRIPRLTSALALAFTLTLLAGFAALLALDHSNTNTATDLRSQIVRVVGASLLILPSMFCVGLVISLVLRSNAERVHRLYGADLAGGGVGCLLLLPLMRWIGGDQGIFAIAALAAVGAALLAHAYGCARTRTLAAVSALACASLPLANQGRALIDVRSHTTQLSGVAGWVDNDREIRREWNELSRLGFFETLGNSSIYVRIDSGCQTTIPSQDPKRLRGFVEDTTFERLPHVLDRHRRYLEIGAGGGRAMVLARASGSEQITGVEINPDIVAASLHGFPGYGVGPPFADEHNQLVVAEGRNYARNCGERFDTVTITFIQTGVASSSAAFALTEANLFTVEAFVEFMSLLDEGGLFYVYRNGGNEMLRLIAMAREALAHLRITDVRAHLFAAMNRDGQAALLVSRSPLSDAEVARLEGECGKLGIQALYSPGWRPGARPPNPFPERVRELRASGELAMGDIVREYKALIHDPRFETIEQTFVTCADPRAFEADYPVDIAAPRDDRPYYFFQGLSKWSDFPLYFDLAGTGILGGTVMLLFWMAAAFSVLVALLILLPLALRRGPKSGGARGLAVLAYFSGLGLGYIAVQISCIQRFTLFLGHPVYALSVVLLAFLVSSGLGAAWSERWFKSGRVTLGRAMTALVVLLLVYNQLLPVVFHSAAMGWPVLARVALSIVLIFPLAFVMGFFFPHGIRTVDRAAPQLIPWAWGANSATSVLGSIVALVLAIHFGFAVVGTCAAALYVVLCLPSGWALERWGRAAS